MHLLRLHFAIESAVFTNQLNWELKAKQKGYEYNRYEGEDRMVGFKQIAYDDEYLNDIEKLIEEREEI